MPLYFLLGTLTYEGQKKVHRNPDLMIEVIREVDFADAKVLGQYAVLGKYDYVMLAEADDNDAVARLSLEIGVRVGLHVETLPAIAIGILTEGEETRLAHEIGATASPPDEWEIPDHEI